MKRLHSLPLHSCPLASELITCACMQYMDRIYVRHQHKAPVHDLGLELWRDCILRQAAIKPRLLATLLGLVHRERCGEVLDRSLMRASTLVGVCPFCQPSRCA